MAVFKHDYSIERIKPLWDKNMSVRQIALELGVERRMLAKKCKEYVAAGDLNGNRDMPRRECHNYTHGYDAVVKMEKFLEMMKAGETILAISKEVDISYKTATRWKKSLIDVGRISEYEYIVARRAADQARMEAKVKEAEKEKEEKHRKKVFEKEQTFANHNRGYYKVVPSTLEDGETRDCTPEISKTCIYGVNETSYEKTGCCRFFECTNNRRGCPTSACTRYVDMRKGHKRLVRYGDD